jgi:hypothetical protein
VWFVPLVGRFVRRVSVAVTSASKTVFLVEAARRVADAGVGNDIVRVIDSSSELASLDAEARTEIVVVSVTVEYVTVDALNMTL